MPYRVSNLTFKRRRKKPSIHWRLQHALYSIFLSCRGVQTPVDTGAEAVPYYPLFAASPSGAAQFSTEVRPSGFARTGDVRLPSLAFAKLLGIAGAAARSVTLQLGEQEIELLGVRPLRLRPYPRPVVGRRALSFSISPIVVSMPKLYARLISAWGLVNDINTMRPHIITAFIGAASTAYKFRDPEDHPLELIAPFQAAPHRQGGKSLLQLEMPRYRSFCGIPVAGLWSESVRYYKGFGLKRTGGSLNIGPEQGRLDDIARAAVEVTALAPPQTPTPHVELLCYRGGFDGENSVSRHK